MAVPARKTSKSKRNKRRSNMALPKTNPNHCKNCGATVLPHRVCKDCGFYGGKEVIKIKS